MAYGTGTPLWGTNQQEGGGGGSGSPNSGQLNNRHSSSGNNGADGGGGGGAGGGPPATYQHSGSYEPPRVTGNNYAEQQTQVMEDTMKTQYQAEGTAQTVLSNMTMQRYQLQGAHDNVWEMREATERAKRELKDLQMKTRAKKRRLQMIIGALGLVDLLFFLRLLQCGGSFFCRVRW